MAGQRSRANYEVLGRSGYGTPVLIPLQQAGTLAAGASTELDSYRVSPALQPDRKGVVLRLASWFVHLASTGGTSGSTIAKLVKNGDTTNGVLATATIAYNAAAKFVEVDLRDGAGSGVPLVAGDRIGLYVTAIPGTASTDISTEVTAEANGVVA